MKHIILGMSALLLGACAQNQQAKTDTVNIGIIQFAEHAALDASREGFLEALTQAGFGKDKVNVTVQNAQGDQANLQTMVSTMKGKNAVNFAIATPAAQALQNADDKTPSVFTAVTDPVSAGLVNSLEKPGGNMTGSIDAVDVTKQMEMLTRVLPQAKRIGIFYNANEVNSEAQAKIAKTALEGMGITVVEKTVVSSNDVQQTLSVLAKEVDAVFFPTDNTVASTIATIGDVLKEAKIPSMGSDEAVLEGVLLTYGVDFKEIGKQAGELAAKLLNGEKPETLAVQTPQKAAVAVNKEMAELLGMSEADIKEKAK